MGASSIIIKGASYIEKPKLIEGQEMDGSLKQLVKNRTMLFNLLIFIGLWVTTQFNWFLVYF